MKIDPARVERFLAAPDPAIVLIFGPDSGLVAERSSRLVRAALGGADDPFRFSDLSDASALPEAAAAAALTGGRRVVRLREADDSAVKALETLLLARQEALVILEAGDLSPKSKLRALAEKSSAIAAIACYPVDAARLPQLLTERLKAEGVTLAGDAAAWLAANLEPEAAALRQAVELLALYAGETGTLALEDARALLAEGGDGSLQAAVDAVLSRDPKATDRAVSIAFAEGVTPIAVIRTLLAELLRLRLAAAETAAGRSARDALGGLRPPVFFKRLPVMTRALSLWPEPALIGAIRTALAAEAACKTTHIPDQIFCRQIMLTLAIGERDAPRGAFPR